tara:strand:+ start:3757 stop:4215 length:459 start_codon:yes stop_codon:yes gene_type:complete
MKNIINKLPKLANSKSILKKNRKIKYDYITSFKEPSVCVQPVFRDMISMENLSRLRVIASEYDHRLPETLKDSGLISHQTEYCNESLALLMVLSQAFVGSYPQYAAKYWSLFVGDDSTEHGKFELNMKLVEAIHKAIGHDIVEIIRSGVTQL